MMLPPSEPACQLSMGCHCSSARERIGMLLALSCCQPVRHSLVVCRWCCRGLPLALQQSKPCILLAAPAARYKLAQLVQYLPLPVIGGYLSFVGEQIERLFAHGEGRESSTI